MSLEFEASTSLEVSTASIVLGLTPMPLRGDSSWRLQHAGAGLAKQSHLILNFGRLPPSLARFYWVQFVSGHATGAWALWSDVMSPLPLIQARLLRAQRLAAAQKLMARTSLKK